MIEEFPEKLSTYVTYNLTLTCFGIFQNELKVYVYANPCSIINNCPNLETTNMFFSR
jgi:hypothetical protein